MPAAPPTPDMQITLEDSRADLQRTEMRMSKLERSVSRRSRTEHPVLGPARTNTTDPVATELMTSNDEQMYGIPSGDGSWGKWNNGVI